MIAIILPATYVALTGCKAESCHTFIGLGPNGPKNQGAPNIVSGLGTEPAGPLASPETKSSHFKASVTPSDLRFVLQCGALGLQEGKGRETGRSGKEVGLFSIRKR